MRLLRVLQHREIERVGGSGRMPVDIRIIAATNQDLSSLVRDGRFREDLFYRLNVFPIVVPPLRQRVSDIPALVQHFIQRKAKELKTGGTPRLAAGAMDSLLAYPWPGNVRELENVIERAMILHRGKPLQFNDLAPFPSRKTDPKDSPSKVEPLGLDAFVRGHIQHVLGLTGGKIHGPGGAGERLGVNPDTLRYRMKKAWNPFRKSENAMIDPDEFFRSITLKLCGHLEIEEGLRACIRYLSRHMPADYLYLEKYDESLGAVRYVARANIEKGERMDTLVPLSGPAKAQAAVILRNLEGKPEPVFVITTIPMKIRSPLIFSRGLGRPPSSVIGIRLMIDGQYAGAVVLVAEGAGRYTDDHANLFATLKEPFFVAMSNTLKHREVLRLKDLLADDNRYLQAELRRISGDAVIGADFGLRQVMHKARQVAALDSPVLLMGETGTGKDVIANTIHFSSERSDGPFVTVNCGAIADSLIDSELFGHEKGAFTGALSSKRGRFERADKGTIFLDEIGELPPPAQVRLLRVLQNKEIERVGGSKTISLDIRIIAATNRNLEEMVKKRKFREDLWFRLNVFPILLPPLRHRVSDIPALVRHFMERKAKELKIGAMPVLAAGAIDTLMAYNWPGNVRELENVIERAMILHSGNPLRFDDLGLSPVEPAGAGAAVPEDETLDLDTLVKGHIQRVSQDDRGQDPRPRRSGGTPGCQSRYAALPDEEAGHPFPEGKKYTEIKAVPRGTWMPPPVRQGWRK